MHFCPLYEVSFRVCRPYVFISSKETACSDQITECSSVLTSARNQCPNSSDWTSFTLRPCPPVSAFNFRIDWNITLCPPRGGAQFEFLWESPLVCSTPEAFVTIKTGKHSSLCLFSPLSKSICCSLYLFDLLPLMFSLTHINRLMF